MIYQLEFYYLDIFHSVDPSNVSKVANSSFDTSKRNTVEMIIEKIGSFLQ